MNHPAVHQNMQWQSQGLQYRLKYCVHCEPHYAPVCNYLATRKDRRANILDICLYGWLFNDAVTRIEWSDL